MSGFFANLADQVQTHGPLCVGLDPHFEDVTTPDQARRFCGRVISATQEHACAFKPNSAFFEALGSQGYEVLEALSGQMQRPMILDVKRGDIGSTAKAYAQAAVHLGASAVTVQPYLGRDAVQPFLDAGLGVFVLCRTLSTF